MRLPSVDSYYVALAECPTVTNERERRTSHIDDENAPDRGAYRFNLGKVPVVLNQIEFRILSFLASKPYRPFTPDRIADAVTTQATPVTAETLRPHILSLRAKLGIFRDYVQTVPYIGYRFKA